MRYIIVTVLVLGAAAVGAFLVGSSKQVSQKTPAPVVQQLQTELAEKERELEQLRSEQQKAAEQVREVARISDEIAAQARAREIAMSNSVAAKAEALAKEAAAQGESGDDGKGGMGKLLAGMLKDPEMRSFVREQQRTVMKQLYAPLEKQLNLTPEESTRFSDLMATNMDKGMEMAAEMFGGSTNRAEMTKRMSEEHKAGEERMKALLGEERYAQYQEYQQTVGDRVQLNMFRQQAGANAISDEQSEALLRLMREEKQKVSSTAGVSFPGQDPAQSQAALASGQLEKLLAAQETVNQNVYQRAGEVLAPEQLQAFGQFQTNQLQMMNMGLKMAGKLMGGGESAPAATGN